MQVMKFFGVLTVVSIAVSGCAANTNDPIADGSEANADGSEAIADDDEAVETNTQELTVSSCRTSASQAYQRCKSLMSEQCIVFGSDICALRAGIPYNKMCDAGLAAANQSCNAGKVRLALYTRGSGSDSLNYETMVGPSKWWSLKSVVHLSQAAGSTPFARKAIYHCEFTQPGYSYIGATDFLTNSSTCDGRKAYTRSPTAINMGYSWDANDSGVRALYKCKRGSTAGSGTWTDEFMSFDTNCGGNTRLGLFAYVKNGG